MVGRGHLVVLCLLFSPLTWSADEFSELRAEVLALTARVQSLQNQLATTAAPPLSNTGISNAPGRDPLATEFVDLSLEEQSSITSVEVASESHVLANPWWQNVEIHGFAAAGAYDTGTAGTRNHGGFEIKEASLFIEADIWEHASFFLEFQTNRLGKDAEHFTRTGEVYLHFRDIAISDEASIGIKLGRIDIPFGEEYLWQDAIDCPSSNKWNRVSDYLKENFVPRFHITRRVVDSATDASRWFFS